MLTALLLTAVLPVAQDATLVPYSRSFSAPAEIPPAVAATDLVLIWNEAALETIRAAKTPPPMAARNLAIVHAAVYDAVNAVFRTHRPYLSDPRPDGASPDAAAAVAAHRVLFELYPARRPQLNDLLRRSLEPLPGERAKAEGVRLGQACAEKALAWREDDGSARQVNYQPGSGPGVWRPTPPGFKPALLPQWPRVTCFVLPDVTRFRPPPPPTLDSPEYAASFREVAALGGVNSPVRTAEQTEIARFWADGEGTVTPPGHWNRIAGEVARQRNQSLSENARMFALLNFALADVGMACWDCKYRFNFWRPVQAVREADANWMPLIDTPPFPAYTSGHSSFSGAAAAVLESFCGTDQVRFRSTSDGLPGVTRSFANFTDAAAEAGQSRIYGGIHWQFDNTVGLATGREIGLYIARNALTPR